MTGMTRIRNSCVMLAAGIGLIGGLAGCGSSGTKAVNTGVGATTTATTPATTPATTVPSTGGGVSY